MSISYCERASERAAIIDLVRRVKEQESFVPGDASGWRYACDEVIAKIAARDVDHTVRRPPPERDNPLGEPAGLGREDKGSWDWLDRLDQQNGHPVAAAVASTLHVGCWVELSIGMVNLDQIAWIRVQEGFPTHLHFACGRSQEIADEDMERVRKRLFG